MTSSRRTFAVAAWHGAVRCRPVQIVEAVVMLGAALATAC